MKKLNINDEAGGPSSIMTAHAWKPWSSTNRFRGFPRQVGWNMVHSIADCRFGFFLKHHGCLADPDLLPEGAMSELWMDASQHLFRQASDFGIHLLTGSKPYWFLEDRLATPQEVLCMLGLPRQLSLASVDTPVKWFVGAQHKRSTHLQDRETLLRDLAGNSVSQPDLAMVLTCALLAVSGGPFGLQVPARFTGHNMDIFYDWEIDPRTRRREMMSVELQYEANDRQADGRQIADTNGHKQTGRNDEYIRQMRRGNGRRAYGRGALSAFREVSARRFLNAGQASSVRSCR